MFVLLVPLIHTGNSYNLKQHCRLFHTRQKFEMFSQFGGFHNGTHVIKIGAILGKLVGSAAA